MSPSAVHHIIVKYFILKFVHNRIQLYINGGLDDIGSVIDRSLGNIPEKPDEILNQMSRERYMAMMITDKFPQSLKLHLLEEISLYFETGNCNFYSKKKDIFAANPTLLDPKSLNWQVDISSCPFDSYLPLPFDELEASAEGGVVTRYCQKQLKNLVAEYRRKMKNVKFHFYASEDLQYCLSETTEKFDVIDSSGLADEVGLANVLVSTIQRLELHPDALLLTESVDWGNLESTVALYLESSLGAPLSMIPTIYGLRLMNHVDLGSTSLIDREYTAYGCRPVTLSWRLAPRF